MRVVAMMLFGHKLPIQNALARLFKALGEPSHTPTASAYVQARHKLKPEGFLLLNRIAVAQFYARWEADAQVRRWCGLRVLASDGTCLNLPDTPAVRDAFSVQVNQHAKGERVQALASVLYDVLNDVALSVALGPKQAEKNFLFETHVPNLTAHDVLVLDRAYADFSVLATLDGLARHYVIRFPRHGFKRVDEFFASGEREREVELEVPANQATYVREHGLARRVRVRLVRVELEGGEVEVLGTNLLDAAAYGAEQIGRLYGLRWGVETYYDRIKNVFEVERFSGQCPTTIRQDVYGVIFLATLEGILSRGPDAELAERGRARATTSATQVNHSVSYSALLDHAVELLLDTRVRAEDVVEQLHEAFKRNPSVVRPGRRNPRPKRSPARSLRHHRYKRINV